MNLLAVDDDEFILELLPMILAKAGKHDVALASSGDAALEMLAHASCAYDCLLLDIQMPGMDGIDLCRRVRQLSEYRKTPIIMLTAMTERNFIDRAFEAGATDYTTKPIDVVELSARLRVAEELVAARREAEEVSSARQTALASGARHGTADLEDAVHLDGVRNLVDRVALGNYLAQLSRAGLSVSQVLAVKIDGIGKIKARGSAADVAFALTEVADAIGQALEVFGYLAAYAGDGVFLCSCNGPSLLIPEAVESEIESAIDDRECVYDNGDPLDIDVSVGIPIRPSHAAPSQIEQTFDKAISRAETRAREKRNLPRGPNIRRVI